MSNSEHSASEDYEDVKALWDPSSDDSKKLNKRKCSKLINPYHKYHDGPLSCAVIEGNLEKVQELISLGTSPNVEGAYQNRPLHNAIMGNQTEILDYLLSITDIDLNAKNVDGQTPLFCAVDENHLHLVKKLVSRNADINLDDILGRTPLHISVGYPDIAYFLILNGADLDAKDYLGDTPLHAAIDVNCLETVCMLLYHNADANSQNDNNCTPFMESILHYQSDVEIKNILLEYVTDFNATTNDGESTLHLALIGCSSSLIKDIIERGVNVKLAFENKASIQSLLKFCDLETFKIVWPRVEYQPLYWNISYLELMLCNWDPQNKDPECRWLPDFLRAIIESGNVSPLLKGFNFTRVNNAEFEFSSRMWECKQNFEILLEICPQVTSDLIFLYLCQGKVLYGELISKIYELFGHCELLRICLHMDIDKSFCKNINMGLILYDPLVSIAEVKKRIHLCDTPANKRLFLRHIRITDNVEHRLCLRELQGIPSLKELARNATRDGLVSKFDLSTSKKYHLFVQNMPISTIYRDILTFKKPIYMHNIMS